jgi:hypothetical protein
LQGNILYSLGRSVKKRALDDNLSNTDILLSNFGANASLIGAVSLVNPSGYSQPVSRRKN